MEPVNTSLKIILMADGAPEGPNHRPWSNAMLNMLVPKSMSTLPGSLITINGFIFNQMSLVVSVDLTKF